MIPCPADHLWGEVDPCHTRSPLRKCDGQLPAAASRIKDVRSPAQAQSIPNAVEVSLAVRRHGVDFGTSIPPLSACVPVGTRALDPACLLVPDGAGIDAGRWWGGAHGPNIAVC